MSWNPSHEKLRYSFSPLRRSSSQKLDFDYHSESMDAYARDSDRHFCLPVPQRMRKKINALILSLLLFVGLMYLLLSGPREAAQYLKNAAFKTRRKALVMATMRAHNMTWLKNVPEDWEVIRYIADDPAAEFAVPTSQGHEAMPYITYVLDNYDDLPDYIVFTHGHQKAWHQPEPLEYILQALNLPVLDQLGLVSLRCTLQNTCEGPEKHVRPIQSIKWELSALLLQMHQLVFRPEDDWYEPLPEAFAFPCCAQFAVTKQQVHKKPKEYWRRIQTVLTRDFSNDPQQWEVGNSQADISWKLGGVFEFTWHWWFSMPSVVCLETDYCRKTVFQDKIHCDGKTWDWTTSQNTWKNITCTLDD